MSKIVTVINKFKTNLPSLLKLISLFFFVEKLYRFFFLNTSYITVINEFKTNLPSSLKLIYHLDQRDHEKIISAISIYLSS